MTDHVIHFNLAVKLFDCGGSLKTSQIKELETGLQQFVNENPIETSSLWEDDFTFSRAEVVAKVEFDPIDLSTQVAQLTRELKLANERIRCLEESYQ